MLPLFATLAPFHTPPGNPLEVLPLNILELVCIKTIKILAKFEGIQFQPAEDYTRLEPARLLVYKAVWMLDRMYSENRFSRQEINKAVATAKLTAPSVAFDIIKNVMTWHGAYGYTKEAGPGAGAEGRGLVYCGC